MGLKTRAHDFYTYDLSASSTPLNFRLMYFTKRCLMTDAEKKWCVLLAPLQLQNHFKPP